MDARRCPWSQPACLPPFLRTSGASWVSGAAGGSQEALQGGQRPGSHFRKNNSQRSLLQAARRMGQQPWQRVLWEQLWRRLPDRGSSLRCFVMGFVF